MAKAYLSYTWRRLARGTGNSAPRIHRQCEIYHEFLKELDYTVVPCVLVSHLESKIRRSACSVTRSRRSLIPKAVESSRFRLRDNVPSRRIVVARGVACYSVVTGNCGAADNGGVSGHRFIILIKVGCLFALTRSVLIN
jgi:hypothetical protein